MNADDAILLVGSLGALLLLFAAPAAIIVVAAASSMRRPGEGPRPTGARGLLVALAGHALGVVTLLCALAGVLGCFVFLDHPTHDVEEIGAYSMIPLTIGGFLLAPSLFAVGVAMARGGGQKTRMTVLGVAGWVAMHHLFASATLLLLFAHELDPSAVLACAAPSIVGLPHAAAMMWVGLFKIGPDPAAAATTPG